MASAFIATAHSAPDLLFSYHFAGTSTVAADTNSAKLKEIFSLPDSVSLRNEVLRKFAETPGEIFGGNAAAKTESATLIRPLLDDLLTVESFAEVRRGTNTSGEVVFGIRLRKDQLGLWETNLQKVVARYSGARVQKTTWEKFEGWEVKQSATPNTIRSIWTGDWLVLGIGQGELPLQNNVLRRLASRNAPLDWKDKTNWLEATIDLPRLRGWLPIAQVPLKLARTDIALSTRGDSLRTVVRAVYPEPLDWKQQKWQIPTNIVRDPLISFTAAQNLSSLVHRSDLLAKTGTDPLTNQFFLWSQAQLPFMTFGAMPVKDSSKTFDHLAVRLPQLLNPMLESKKAGQIVLSTNNDAIVWSGLSMIAPHLKATNEAAGQFIMGGLFPQPPSKDAPPRELIEQITSRTNLIYYDWEITQHRLGHWQMLTKMLPFIGPQRVPVAPELVAQAKTNQTLRAQLSTRILHERWQSKVAPFLGNTITEVTQIAPNEIEVVRKSHVGFTGFELIYVSHWLNHPGFPLFRENVSPRRN